MQYNIKQVLQDFHNCCKTVAALISILFELAANDGVPSSPVLSFIACFILLVIAPLLARISVLLCVHRTGRNVGSHWGRCNCATTARGPTRRLYERSTSTTVHNVSPQIRLTDKTTASGLTVWKLNFRTLYSNNHWRGPVRQFFGGTDLDLKVRGIRRKRRNGTTASLCCDDRPP